MMAARDVLSKTLVTSKIKVQFVYGRVNPKANNYIRH